jgi:anti-anti-sigma factor
MTVSPFAILERQGGGRVRMLLTGELDLATVPVLEERLCRSRDSELAVWLDLSRLEFIDSAGVQALIRAMDDASANGWHLRIDRRVARQAMRLFEVLHFERLIPGYDSNTC